MHVIELTNVEELQKIKCRWDALAGECPTSKWPWQSTWWRHYGEGRQLMVLAVVNERSDTDWHPDNVIAVLPCYLESTLARGNTLGLLGDGEVCTEHLDILADSAQVDIAASALATYLVDHSDRWDAIEFAAIGTDSRGIMKLSDELAALECQVAHAPNANRWAIPLPGSWEEFLALQSKSHRKQLRRLERTVHDTEQAAWHLVETADQFDIAWAILIDLHQRRRISLGEPGCFASPRWAAFHRDVAQQLLSTGELRLSWLEVSGKPVAAEYQFASRHTSWAYQGGLDPDLIEQQPGKLSMVRTIQHAISEGHTAYDLMRGDEPYKAHWRAQPTETVDIQVVPPRGTAVLRNQAANCVENAVKLTRQITNILN